jgi:hypothetical protein
MMIYSFQDIHADSVISKGFVLGDSAKVRSDTICKRNSISDVTFYDSNNIIKKIGSYQSNGFPIQFIENTRQIQSEKKDFLIKQLRPGEDLPVFPEHNDWLLGVVLFSAFLFSIIRTTSKSMLPGAARFFLLRGINDPFSRGVNGLFHWQSTMLNLISFLTLGLFVYSAASYNDLIPGNLNGMVLWLILVGVIISAVTLRHIVCYFTGLISGENELFREYLHGVYQFYRFSALFLFIVIILTSYTVLLPIRLSIFSGMLVIGFLYLIRILRLMIFFINRNISIIYFILYLCALEILPVLVSLKYVSGLV